MLDLKRKFSSTSLLCILICFFVISPSVFSNQKKDNRPRISPLETNSLKTSNSGITHSYLAENTLPKYRDVTFCLLGDKDLMPPPEIVEGVPETPSTPKPLLEPISTQKKKQIAIKTNLLFWAATIANLGIEYPIGDKYSIDLPIFYSPYMLSRKYRAEVLTIQPELRYWFNDQLDGWFAGLHAHLGWFNVSFNNKNRFQDKNGDTPLWGGGLSFGYSKKLSDLWALEFSLGAGYAKIDYDIFRNYHNGPKYDTNRINYWGVTHAGVTVVYKININKKQ